MKMTWYERLFFLIMFALFTSAWILAIKVYPNLISQHSLESLLAPLVAALLFWLLRETDPAHIALWEFIVAVVFIVGCIVTAVYTVDGRTAILAVLGFFSLWVLYGYFRVGTSARNHRTKRPRKQPAPNDSLSVMEDPEPEPAA